MINFVYKGRQKGRVVKGSLSASSLANARMILRQQKIEVIKVKQKKIKHDSSLNMQITWGPFGKISDKEILMFSKKLSTMIRAGLPIMDSLNMIHSQTKGTNLRQVIGSMVNDLNVGKSLTEIFKRHDKHFDNVYVNMIQAGEISGKLDVFIDKLVQILEKQAKIKAGIKSALFYPITLLVVTLGISVFMLTNVVPTFQTMYEDMGLTLPKPTQVIVDIGEWVSSIGNVMGVVISFILIISFHKFMKHYVSIYLLIWCKLLLKIPLFGDIFLKAVIARTTLLMANLLAAGVSVLDTIEVAKSVTNNILFLKAFERIKKRIVLGVELSVLFSRERIFPSDLSQLLAVGEQTGNMDEMLTAVSNYYEEEFNSMVAGLSTIIEPLMIVIVGAVIGAMVVALYLPIFSAGDLAAG